MSEPDEPLYCTNCGQATDVCDGRKAHGFSIGCCYQCDHQPTELREHAAIASEALKDDE